MDTSEFDEKIEAAAERLKSLREEMAEARDRLAAALGEFAAGWFERQLKSAIDRNPQRVKELGLEGVRALKAALVDLQNNVGGIVQARFLEEVEWPDEQDQPPGWSMNPYALSTGHSRFPKVYDDQVRRVLGAVQPVMGEYGLSIDGPDRPERSHGDRFPYALDVPSELREPVKAYGDLCDEFARAWAMQIHAEKAKAKAEAEDLWNRA